MSKRGVTLIEIVVSTTIVLILFSIATTYYQSYVRASYQVEAQQSLAQVRQLQKSFESEELEFQSDLRKLPFEPEGPLRYNIGAYWTTTDLHQSIYDSSTNPLCNKCDTNDDGTDNSDDNTTCCMDNVKTKSSVLSLYCFGPAGAFSASNLSSANVDCTFSPSHQASQEADDKVAGVKRRFRYYAIGCVNNRVQDTGDIDVWSITHNGVLKNHRDATQRGTPPCN